MSRKTLNIADIQNELETGSSFFPSRTPVAQKAAQKPKRRAVKKKPKPLTAPATKPSTKQSYSRPVDNPPPDADGNRGATKEHKIEGMNDATTPTPQSRPQDPTTVSSNDTTVSRHHDTTPPPIEPIRRAVKQIGKEAATHRFTVAEKRAIADIVYTLGQQGYRTSENELARIAINSLLLDYKEHGEQSILYRVIKALNE